MYSLFQGMMRMLREEGKSAFYLGMAGVIEKPGRGFAVMRVLYHSSSTITNSQDMKSDRGERRHRGQASFLSDFGGIPKPKAVHLYRLR
jgi:hypothetical protein